MRVKDITIPGVDTAIRKLRPNVGRWELYNTSITIWEDASGSEPPTWNEIQEQILKDVEVYNYYLYARNREEQYGDWREQLEMMFNDIKSGDLQNGEWVKMIERVKSENPKPHVDISFNV